MLIKRLVSNFISATVTLLALQTAQAQETFESERISDEEETFEIPPEELFETRERVIKSFTFQVKVTDTSVGGQFYNFQLGNTTRFNEHVFSFGIGVDKRYLKSSGTAEDKTLTLRYLRDLDGNTGFVEIGTDVTPYARFTSNMASFVKFAKKVGDQNLASAKFFINANPRFIVIGFEPEAKTKVAKTVSLTTTPTLSVTGQLYSGKVKGTLEKDYFDNLFALQASASSGTEFTYAKTISYVHTLGGAAKVRVAKNVETFLGYTQARRPDRIENEVKVTIQSDF